MFVKNKWIYYFACIVYLDYAGDPQCKMCFIFIFFEPIIQYLLLKQHLFLNKVLEKLGQVFFV